MSEPAEDRPKTEPAADLRAMATMMWQMFVALRDEGFTDAQALVIIGQVIAAGIANQKPDD